MLKKFLVLLVILALATNVVFAQTVEDSIKTKAAVMKEALENYHSGIADVMLGKGALTAQDRQAIEVHKNAFLSTIENTNFNDEIAFIQAVEDLETDDVLKEKLKTFRIDHLEMIDVKINVIKNSDVSSEKGGTAENMLGLLGSIYSTIKLIDSGVVLDEELKSVLDDAAIYGETGTESGSETDEEKGTTGPTSPAGSEDIQVTAFKVVKGSSIKVDWKLTKAVSDYVVLLESNGIYYVVASGGALSAGSHTTGTTKLTNKAYVFDMQTKKIGAETTIGKILEDESANVLVCERSKIDNCSSAVSLKDGNKKDLAEQLAKLQEIVPADEPVEGKKTEEIEEDAVLKKCEGTLEMKGEKISCFMELANPFSNMDATAQIISKSYYLNDQTEPFATITPEQINEAFGFNGQAVLLNANSAAGLTATIYRDKGYCDKLITFDAMVTPVQKTVDLVPSGPILIEGGQSYISDGNVLIGQQIEEKKQEEIIEEKASELTGTNKEAQQRLDAARDYLNDLKSNKLEALKTPLNALEVNIKAHLQSMLLESSEREKGVNYDEKAKTLIVDLLSGIKELKNEGRETRAQEMRLANYATDMTGLSEQYSVKEYQAKQTAKNARKIKEVRKKALEFEHTAKKTSKAFKTNANDLKKLNESIEKLIDKELNDAVSVTLDGKKVSLGEFIEEWTGKETVLVKDGQKDIQVGLYKIDLSKFNAKTLEKIEKGIDKITREIEGKVNKNQTKTENLLISSEAILNQQVRISPLDGSTETIASTKGLPEATGLILLQGETDSVGGDKQEDVQETGDNNVQDKQDATIQESKINAPVTKNIATFGVTCPEVVSGTEKTETEGQKAEGGYSSKQKGKNVYVIKGLALPRAVAWNLPVELKGELAEGQTFESLDVQPARLADITAGDLILDVGGNKAVITEKTKADSYKRFGYTVDSMKLKGVIRLTATAYTLSDGTKVYAEPFTISISAENTESKSGEAKAMLTVKKFAKESSINFKIVQMTITLDFSRHSSQDFTGKNKPKYLDSALNNLFDTMPTDFVQKVVKNITSHDNIDTILDLDLLTGKLRNLSGIEDPMLVVIPEVKENNSVAKRSVIKTFLVSANHKYPAKSLLLIDTDETFLAQKLLVDKVKYSKLSAVEQSSALELVKDLAQLSKEVGLSQYDEAYWAKKLGVPYGQTLPKKPTQTGDTEWEDPITLNSTDKKSRKIGTSKFSYTWNEKTSNHPDYIFTFEGFTKSFGQELASAEVRVEAIMEDGSEQLLDCDQSRVTALATDATLRIGKKGGEEVVCTLGFWFSSDIPVVKLMPVEVKEKDDSGADVQSVTFELWILESEEYHKYVEWVKLKNIIVKEGKAAGPIDASIIKSIIKHQKYIFELEEIKGRTIPKDVSVIKAEMQVWAEDKDTLAQQQLDCDSGYGLDAKFWKGEEAKCEVDNTWGSSTELIKITGKDVKRGVAVITVKLLNDEKKGTYTDVVLTQVVSRGEAHAELWGNPDNLTYVNAGGTTVTHPKYIFKLMKTYESTVTKSYNEYSAVIDIRSETVDTKSQEPELDCDRTTFKVGDIAKCSQSGTKLIEVTLNNIDPNARTVTLSARLYYGLVPVKYIKLKVPKQTK